MNEQNGGAQADAWRTLRRNDDGTRAFPALFSGASRGGTRHLRLKWGILALLLTLLSGSQAFAACNISFTAAAGGQVTKVGNEYRYLFTQTDYDNCDYGANTTGTGDSAMGIYPDALAEQQNPAGGSEPPPHPSTSAQATAAGVSDNVYIISEGGGPAATDLDSLRYTPPAGFSGTDTFKFYYFPHGGNITETTATVTVPATGPTITALSPTAGGIAGGTSVVITGTGFTGVTAVKFGSTNASSFTVNSATQITCTAPSTAASTVDITVTTAQGTSVTVSADHYTYTTPVVAGAVTAIVGHGTSNNPITLNLSGGAAASVAVATAPTHGTATASNTTITYTPTASYSGSDSFTYTATNAAGTSSAATATVTVSDPTLTIAPVSGTALTGTSTVSYSKTFLASGGTSPYTYALTPNSGSMPSGLAFNTGTGVLSGTPTTTGTVNFTVTATDASTGTGSFSVSGTYNLTVAALPVGTLSFATPTAASVTLGGSLSNAASSTLTGGSYGAISYGSSDTTVATVNASGVVTTLSTGTTVITATQSAVAGVNAQATQTYTLTVTALPVGTLSFTTPTSASVTLSGSLSNAASSTLTGGSYGAISYGSSDTTVATVNASGVVTTLSTGTTVITATQAAVAGVNAQATQTYTLTVNALPVGTVTFATAGSVTVALGNTLTNSASSTLSGGSYGAISYSSSSTSVATVNASTGLVTPISTGTVVITATQAAVTGVNALASQSYSLAVSALPAGTLSFSTPDNATVTMGGHLTNAASSTLSGGSYGAISYSSANSSVATVNASTGAVTPVSVGTVFIIATQAATAANAQASKSYTLTVTALPVGTLSFSTPGSASVAMGGALTNAATSTLSGGSYGTISYGSSNTSVATVNASGVVTPLSVGSTMITATQAAVAGVNAQATQSYTLTVGAGSSSVVLTSSPAAPILGQAVTLTATITPSTATGTVNFFDGGATLGHSSVSGGRATLVISSLTAGAHPLTAAYSGDGSHSAATSAVTTVTVGQHADPTTNAVVKQSVTTQVATVQRFSQAQLTNIYSHVRLLHNDFTIANRLDLGINAKGVDTLRTLGNALYASYANGGQSQPQAGGGALKVAKAGFTPGTARLPAMQSEAVGFTPGAARAPAVQSDAASEPRMDSDVLRIVGLPVGVWSAGSVQIGSMGTDNGGHTNFSSSGLTMGMDVQWSSNLIAGLSVGYAQGTTTMDALGSESKSQMWSGSLYATYRPAEKWFIDALLGGGSMGYDNHRWDDVNSTLLSGDRHGLSLFGSLSLTREFEALDLRLHPFGRFDASETLLDRYSEQGSSAALTYKDSSFITTSFTGGLEVFKDIALDSGQLSPSAKVQLAHRTSGDVKQDVFYTDMGAGSANYSMLVGSGTPEDVQSFGLGLNFKNRYGLQTNLSWLSSFGANEYRSNSFKLDVRMSF